MTLLSLYKYIFVTELLIAELLFTRRLPKRRKFAFRLIGGIVLCYAIALLFPLFDDKYNGWYVSLMFIVLFAATVCMIVFCYNTSLKNVFFCCVAAYTAQHLGYELFKLLLLPFTEISVNDMYGSGMISLNAVDLRTLLIALAYVDVYIAVYGLTYFVFGKKIGHNGELHIKNTSMFFLSTLLLFVDILLNAFTVYVTTDYNFLYDVIIGAYNCLCCILVFYMQRSIVITNDIENELDTIRNLLNQAQRQYEMRKEEIDLINIKSHDLKHRIGKVVGGLDDKSVREIEDMVSMYDTNINTGNKVVDVILTEKSLICHSKKINMVCMADCSALGFVSEGDLYALFGNIVENAIDAVTLLECDEKKYITLNVCSRNGCISIVSENYYDSNLTLVDGLPQTTKHDKNLHGYGLKSVRYIAEKYGGNVSLNVEDGIFRINILIPVHCGFNQKNKEEN